MAVLALNQDRVNNSPNYTQMHRAYVKDATLMRHQINNVALREDPAKDEFIGDHKQGIILGSVGFILAGFFWWMCKK